MRTARNSYVRMQRVNTEYCGNQCRVLERIFNRVRFYAQTSTGNGKEKAMR